MRRRWTAGQYSRTTENLNRRDGVGEGSCRLKVAVAQADGKATAGPDCLNWPPRKAPAHAKVPVPQTDTGR